MNETDGLDEVLNRSAPPPVTSTPALRRDIAALSREARTANVLRRRPTRTLVGAGLSLLLLSGAGTAVASTTFDWAPWAQDPDIYYPFTLPSGRECEARVQMLVVTDISEYGEITTGYDDALTDHFRAFDAIAASDIEGSINEVLRRKGGGSMTVIAPDGSISDVPETPEGPTADDLFAAAADDALGDVLRAEAAEYGLALDGWSTNYDMQCESIAE